MFASYNPKDVAVIFGGIPLDGFVDGTFLDLQFDEVQWNKVTGADGLTSRAKTNNYAGILTLTLQQTSNSNDYLAGIWNADRRTSAGVLPLLVKDASGRTVIAAKNAWIRQAPNLSFSKEVEGREWALDLDDMEWFGGGNQPL